MRLAETFSRGHQRLQNHASLNTTLGEFFPYQVAGHRRTGGDVRGDVAEQVASPLETTAALIGDDHTGALHVRVSTRAEVAAVVRDRFALSDPTDTWCSFCHEKCIPPEDLKYLLRGHSFWILVSPACEPCQDELELSASSIGVELCWFGPYGHA